jgi:4-hydroxybenzoate polyprenyltransferase
MAAATPPAGRVARLLDMIKFPHTIFALPFALTGLVLASGGLPKGRVVLWVVAAMVGARTAAMGWNRIADRDIDARNPRTASRHLPAGTVRVTEAWALTLAGAALLLLAAWRLNPLCLELAPVALAAFLFYPYTKRFTWLCHFFLGLCLAAAPVGAWIAARGSLDPRILPLAAAVLLWTAGFDILYALQDLEHDRKEGLHSLPRVLGTAGSLAAARLLHGGMFALLVWEGFLLDLGLFYWAALAVTAGLLVYEHRLVSPRDLSKLDAAFFTMNGIVSLVVFVGTFLDVAAGGLSR